MDMAAWCNHAFLVRQARTRRQLQRNCCILVNPKEMEVSKPKAKSSSTNMWLLKSEHCAATSPAIASLPSNAPAKSPSRSSFSLRRSRTITCRHRPRWSINSNTLPTLPKFPNPQSTSWSLHSTPSSQARAHSSHSNKTSLHRWCLAPKPLPNHIIWLRGRLAPRATRDYRGEALVQMGSPRTPPQATKAALCHLQ